ncbi:MAG: hypothetical protein QXU87_08195 [Candidatus Caldarchaeum sp.]
MIDDILHIHPQTPLNIFPDGRAFRWRMVLRREVFPPVGESLRRPRPPGTAMSTGDMVEGPSPGFWGACSRAKAPVLVAGSGSGSGRRPEPTRPGVWRGGVDTTDGELSPKRGL